MLKFRDLLISLKSSLADCQTIVNDLGVFPFFLYGKFIQNRLVLKHWKISDDQNLRHLVNPVLSCMNACLKIAEDAIDSVETKVS